MAYKPMARMPRVAGFIVTAEFGPRNSKLRLLPARARTDCESAALAGVGVSLKP